MHSSSDGTGTGKTIPAPNEFTTEAAATKLGISRSQFRRLATARGYDPSRIEHWHYGRQSGTRHFWSRRTVALIRRTNDYARTVERAARHRRHLDDLRAKWAREEAERRLAQEVLRAEVARISLDEHVRLALECLHAANRAAKHAADVHDRAIIYSAKDRFLSALIRADRATVGTFVIQQGSRRQVCSQCGHEWVGDSYCYPCDDHTGVSSPELRRWYLVDCGAGYRFHRPDMEADLVARAVSTEPHDPTQEPRTIPPVRFGAERDLDLGMQVEIVLSAAARLASGASANKDPCDPARDADGTA